MKQNKKNIGLVYCNPKTLTITNYMGFPLYKAYNVKDFRRAVRRYRAIKLEY
jgi:hypothetical protein